MQKCTPRRDMRFRAHLHCHVGPSPLDKHLEHAELLGTDLVARLLGDGLHATLDEGLAQLPSLRAVRA